MLSLPVFIYHLILHTTLSSWLSSDFSFWLLSDVSIRSYQMLSSEIYLVYGFHCTFCCHLMFSKVLSSGFLPSLSCDVPTEMWHFLYLFAHNLFQSSATPASLFWKVKLLNLKVFTSYLLQDLFIAEEYRWFWILL
jgi:hypothetical protein